MQWKWTLIQLLHIAADYQVFSNDENVLYLLDAFLLSVGNTEMDETKRENIKRKPMRRG